MVFTDRCLVAVSLRNVVCQTFQISACVDTAGLVVERRVDVELL